MATVPASPRAVLLNWLWLLTAQVGVRVIALAYAIFLTRSLGPVAYGQYGWVIATVMLVSMIPEAGLNRLLVRDLGRDTTGAPALLGSVIRLRLGLGVIALVAMLFVLLGLGGVDDAARRTGLIIVGTLLIVRGPLFTFDAAYYGVEQARYSGVSQVLVTAVGAAIGTASVLSGRGLTGVFVGVLVAHVVQAAYLYVHLSRVGLRVDWRASLPLAPLLKNALPYALLAVVGMIYFRIDTVMIGLMRGETSDYDTGIYTAAFKLLEVLMFVPGTLAALILPRMARYHDDDTSRLRDSHTRLTRLLLVAAVPITAFVYVGSPWIIQTLFGGAYAESVPVLRLLAIAFLFHCLHTPNATLVLSGTVLGPVVWLSLYTAGANVVLNWMFIPQYGPDAAAATTLASEVLSWIVFTVYIHLRVVRLEGLIGALLRPGIAACGAVAVLFMVELTLPVAGAAALLVYAVGILLTGAVTREDLDMLRRSNPRAQIDQEPDAV